MDREGADERDRDQCDEQRNSRLASAVPLALHLFGRYRNALFGAWKGETSLQWYHVWLHFDALSKHNIAREL